MNRRQYLRAGVAVGVGWCWGALPVQAQAIDWWGQVWPGPQGERVAAQHFWGRPLLVNFWATWCPPCVKELPLLDQLAQTQAQAGGQGLRVLGIAADKAANVTRWLQRQPLSFPVVIAETGGVALTRPLGNSNGGLPFSLLFDGAGQLKQRRIGAFTEEILQRWMAAVAP